MSNRVKIGAIGTNPLIEEINKLNSVDIQGYAVKKMEELLFTDQLNELDWYAENLMNLVIIPKEQKDAE
ncbi:hypothetical protein D7V83_13990 [bacterium 0.1xD8-71]|nr:hypothetical protein D7V83_13990 [bacterium 0.1xD8-71]